ncbi:MAG: WG repeat-containing protein [Cetobacterium sp.]
MLIIRIILNLVLSFFLIVSCNKKEITSSKLQNRNVILIGDYITYFENGQIEIENSSDNYRVNTGKKYDEFRNLISIISNNEFFKASESSTELILIQKNKKYGYMNKIGETVIPCIYDSSSDLAAGNRNRKYGYINKLGQALTKFEYTKANDFGLYDEAYVEKGSECGYINKKGEFRKLNN